MKGNISTNLTEMKKGYIQLYANKLDELDEIDEYLEVLKSYRKLTLEEITN